MHYEIDYSKLPPERAHAKALADIKDYIGIPRFKKICQAVHREQGLSREGFLMGLSIITGIEGFPAQAWADELGLVSKVVTISTQTAPNS